MPDAAALFDQVARDAFPEFVAGIGPIGAPSRVLAAQVLWSSAVDKILDVGCGPGVFRGTLQLHHKSPDLQYTGVDASERMLAKARELHSDLPPATFIKARIDDLPYENAAFPGVVCRHVLEHLESPWSACRELARVTGRLLLLVFSQWPNGGGESVLTDSHLGCPRWSHSAPILRQYLEGAGIVGVEAVHFDPRARGVLDTREALWICRKRPKDPGP